VERSAVPFPALTPTCRSVVDGLTPVSGDPDVAPAAGNPSPGNPDRARPRRLGPVPTYPDISSPIPPVISGHPYPACMQRRTRALDNNCRRGTSVDNDLRCCRTYAQANPAYDDEQPFPDLHELSAKSCDNSLYDCGQNWIVKNQPERKPKSENSTTAP
jgi:hypothetical protein